jgi:hypothetical protein
LTKEFVARLHSAEKPAADTAFQQLCGRNDSRHVRSILIRDCCMWRFFAAIGGSADPAFGHLIVILAADRRFIC